MKRTLIVLIFVLAWCLLFSSIAMAQCNLSIINATRVTQTIFVRGQQVGQIPPQSADIIFGVVPCIGGVTVTWTTDSYGVSLWPQNKKGDTFAINIRN
jgi:hypothetical protein